MDSLTNKYVIEWPGPWWWVGAFAFAAFCATLVFFERQPWTRRFRYYLAANRAIVAALLVLFVANPLLHIVRNRTVPPNLTLAIDDSRSVGRFLGADTARYKNTLANLAKQIEKIGYKVKTVSFKGETKADSLTFKEGTSNLDRLYSKADVAPDEGRPGPIVFCTDGLDTYGNALAERPFRVPAYALTVGKADKKPDSRIISVTSRRKVQAEADFPLTIYLGAEALPAAKRLIYISIDGQPRPEQGVSLGGAARSAKLDVVLPAGKAGMHTVKIRLQPAPGELNTQNNETIIYIEAAAIRKRVLVAAAAPHPDVKAILLALANRDLLQAEAWYPNLGPPPAYQPDVLVLHGLPTGATGMPGGLQSLLGKVPVWYVLSASTDLNAFNQTNGILAINTGQGQADEATGQLVNGFAAFSTQGISQQTLDNLPPLAAVYGLYKPKGPLQVLLTQKIGAAQTDKPLWVFGRAGKQGAAVLAGTGLWQWRLQETATLGSAPTTDALIAGTIQLLLAQANTRRFVCEPQNSSNNLGDGVPFQTSLQDASGEPVFGNTIKIAYTGPTRGTAQFVNADFGTVSEIPGLPAGAYSYVATTTLGAERFSESGRFMVQAQDLESIEAGANLPMLDALAARNNGIATDWHDPAPLLKQLADHRPPGTIVSDEDTDELRRQWWFIAIMLCIYAVEWGSRRFNGGI